MVITRKLNFSGRCVGSAISWCHFSKPKLASIYTALAGRNVFLPLSVYLRLHSFTSDCIRKHPHAFDYFSRNPLASACIRLLQSESACIRMHSITSVGIRLHPHAFDYFSRNPLASACIRLPQSESACIRMHSITSVGIRLHPHAFDYLSRNPLAYVCIRMLPSASVRILLLPFTYACIRILPYISVCFPTPAFGVFDLCIHEQLFT
jgi:hypothetical protein